MKVEKAFGLTATMAVSNMHFYDHRGQIVKYDDVESIIRNFFHLRVSFYSKRKVSISLYYAVLMYDSSRSICWLS